MQMMAVVFSAILGLIVGAFIYHTAMMSQLSKDNQERLRGLCKKILRRENNDNQI